jgi:anti-sigma factor (TIGR02949 family)
MSDEPRAIDCRTAVQQLWDYLDDELNDARMVEVRHHLLTCKSCLPHAEFGRLFIQALSRARERHVMPPAVRSQVMAALAEAGYSSESPD